MEDENKLYFRQNLDIFDKSLWGKRGVEEWRKRGVGSGGLRDQGGQGGLRDQGGQGKVKNDILLNFASIKLSACANQVTKSKLSD